MVLPEHRCLFGANKCMMTASYGFGWALSRPLRAHGPRPARGEAGNVQWISILKTGCFRGRGIAKSIPKLSQLGGKSRNASQNNCISRLASQHYPSRGGKLTRMHGSEPGSGGAQADRVLGRRLPVGWVRVASRSGYRGLIYLLTPSHPRSVRA